MRPDNNMNSNYTAMYSQWPEHTSMLSRIFIVFTWFSFVFATVSLLFLINPICDQPTDQYCSPTLSACSKCSPNLDYHYDIQDTNIFAHIFNFTPTVLPCVLFVVCLIRAIMSVLLHHKSHLTQEITSALSLEKKSRYSLVQEEDYSAFSVITHNSSCAVINNLELVTCVFVNCWLFLRINAWVIQI